MARVGLLTVSDGRDHVARDVRGHRVRAEDGDGRHARRWWRPRPGRPGEHLAELRAACALLNIEYHGMGDAEA